MALLGVPLTQAQGALIDFNTAGDLTNNFFIAVSGGGTTAKYPETDGIGIGDPASRAINPTGTDNEYGTVIYKQESFSLFEVGSSITISAFSKRLDDGNNSNTSAAFIRLGLTTGNSSNNDRMTGGTGSALGLDVSANIGDPRTDVLFKTSNKVNGAGQVFATAPGGPSTLAAGEWYKLTATFTNVGSNSVSISGSLESYGLTGLSEPLSIRTIAPITVTNSFLIADTTLYGAFLARTDGGSDAIDNFSIIPEPASCGLFAAGVLGMIARRRRARG